MSLGSLRNESPSTEAGPEGSISAGWSYYDYLNELLSQDSWRGGPGRPADGVPGLEAGPWGTGSASWYFCPHELSSQDSWRWGPGRPADGVPGLEALGELDLTVSMNCSLRTAGEGDRVGRQTGSLAGGWPVGAMSASWSYCVNKLFSQDSWRGGRVGRQTGSLAWRLARGELGQSTDLTVSMNCSLRTAGEGDRVGRQTGSLAGGWPVGAMSASWSYCVNKLF